ncbi:MAG: ABC transporter permease [Bacteroidales bacterium]|nr:ABC transporter permease [Bacteroidales bacterium]
MFDLDKYKEIWQTISRNKMRSFLTAFGVSWGIFMFVVMSGVGKGFQNGFMTGLTDFAQNSVFLFSNRTSVEYKGFNSGRFWNLTNEDIDLVKQNIPEVKYISGNLGIGSRTVIRGEKSEDYFVQGIGVDYYKIDPQPIMFGRVFNPVDIQEKRKVCVIGRKVYEALFKNDENPIGERLSVNNIYYTIIGVVNPSGKVNIGGDASESITVPATTLQQVENYGNIIGIMAIAAYDNIDIKDVEKKVKDVLKVKHFIAPEDDTAIDSFNLKEMFLMFSYLFLGIQLLIWFVGIGTLLAGVVGISNIMLVSIRERTNEIGIKRALGAKPAAILKQIVGESVTLTLIAGLVGLCLGVGVLSVVDKITAVSAAAGETMFASPQISFSLAVLALTILIVSGVLAGIIPARKALEIKAIDALRDE